MPRGELGQSSDRRLGISLDKTVEFVFDSSEPLLDEAIDHRLQAWSIETREREPAPLLERSRRVTRGQPGTESSHVDLVVGDVQPVGGTGADQRLVADGASQPRHVALQCLGRSPRRVVVPEQVDQPRHRNGLFGAEDECCQELLTLRGTEVDRRAVFPDERHSAEQPDLHEPRPFFPRHIVSRSRCSTPERSLRWGVGGAPVEYHAGHHAGQRWARPNRRTTTGRSLTSRPTRGVLHRLMSRWTRPVRVPAQVGHAGPPVRQLSVPSAQRSSALRHYAGDPCQVDHWWGR